MFSDFSGEASSDNECEIYNLRRTPKHRKRIKFNEEVEVYRYEGTRAHFDIDGEENEKSEPELPQAEILDQLNESEVPTE